MGAIVLSVEICRENDFAQVMEQACRKRGSGHRAVPGLQQRQLFGQPRDKSAVAPNGVDRKVNGLNSK
jgi:hypothetical protein